MIGINLSECKKILQERLVEISDGFKLRKAAFEYVRKRASFTDYFRVLIHKMSGWYIVVPCISIGVPHINEIYNKITKKKEIINRITYSFSIDNKYKRERGRYYLENDEDFEKTSVNLLNDFKEVALPWFLEMKDLESVSRALNHDASGSTSQACKGLIAAFLTNNPDWEKMAETYYKNLSKSQGEDLAAIIIKTRDYLRSSIKTISTDSKAIIKF